MNLSTTQTRAMMQQTQQRSTMNKNDLIISALRKKSFSKLSTRQRNGEITTMKPRASEQQQQQQQQRRSDDDDDDDDDKILEQIKMIKEENEALKKDLQQKVQVRRRKKKSTTTNAATEAFAGELPQVYVGDSKYKAAAAADEITATKMKTTEGVAAAATQTMDTAASSKTNNATTTTKTNTTKTTTVINSLTPGFEIDPIVKSESPKRIVFVTSEVAPWSKTGGLADVCGSLPQALVARGHRVMVIAPRYLNGTKTDKLYEGAFDTCVKSKLGCFQGLQEVGYFHQIKNGVDYVFVDHPSYQRAGSLYSDTTNKTYGDNQFRYTLLAHAACEAPLVLPFENNGGRYGDDVVFVANDWHAGLVPTLVASKYRPHNVYNNARTICAIHNIAHQGVEPSPTFSNLGVPGEWYSALEYTYPEWMRAHELDEGKVVNILKGAIATCDRVLTVSEGYAYEITTPEGGKGLEGLLAARAHRLNGVANGIDLEEWNPSNDKDCAAPYSILDFSGKLECKRALQREMGLPERDDVPVLGFIGRLDWQKGPDLIRDALSALMNEDCQIIMLGSGLSELEEWMKWAERQYPDRFRGWVGFSVPMAHRITAGVDIFLMPSRFEPCGLNQLYSMRYGTLPVAHATGGLRDTIKQHNPFADISKPEAVGEVGTGWLFSNMSSQDFIEATKWAIHVYKEKKDVWRAMQIQAMTQDLSWNKKAAEWEQIFDWAKIDPPHCS
jgi:starch synthase